MEKKLSANTLKLSAIETGLNLRCDSMEKQINDKVNIKTLNALKEKLLLPVYKDARKGKNVLWRIEKETYCLYIDKVKYCDDHFSDGCANISSISESVGDDTE